MLECPFCRQQIRPQNSINGFRCPNPDCNNWIRLRANQNQSPWLEPGVIADRRFQPILLAPQRSQRGTELASGRRQTYPNVDDLDLQAVRLRRQEVVTRRRQLDEQIEETYRLRANNLQNEQLVRRYNTDLTRCFQEQNDLQEYAQQLTDRETALLEQQRRTSAASSSNLGMQFGCSMFVAGLAIFMFTRMINLSLDSHAWLVLLGTAFGAGVAMFVVSQID
jgi:hypothetical protein